MADFEPDFHFEPVDPLPVEEFRERVARLRSHAAGLDCDAILVHADPVGWYHPSNSFLRYLCDWIREGILVIPTDPRQQSTLLSFFSAEVLFPPPGEPTWLDDVRQVGAWSREKYARPGRPVDKVAAAVAGVLRDELSLASPRLATIGDRTSLQYWTTLDELLPHTEFADLSYVVHRMQRQRSIREQAVVRAAAQLIDIGVQAAYHVATRGVSDYELYAAFTYAQLARGGETGDGYQIGINASGTHIGKPYGHVLRSGDIVNLYLSRITYRGYDAQAARMILVGKVTVEQERAVELGVESVRRAIAVARPGASLAEVNAAAFSVYVENGVITSADAHEMPYSLEPGSDGGARVIHVTQVEDADWERQGRSLRHVYPPVIGQLGGPGIGHSVAMSGMRGYTVSSANNDVLEPGMTFVVHSQWFHPLKAGCNVGNCLLVTDAGVEDLNSHTALEPLRIP